MLGGHTKVADPTANFRNSFEGTKPVSGYGLANALVKVNFAYAGYTNSFNLVNEIKVRAFHYLFCDSPDKCSLESYQNATQNSTSLSSRSNDSLLTCQHRLLRCSSKSRIENEFCFSSIPFLHCSLWIQFGFPSIELPHRSISLRKPARSQHWPVSCDSRVWSSRSSSLATDMGFYQTLRHTHCTISSQILLDGLDDSGTASWRCL